MSKGQEEMKGRGRERGEEGGRGNSCNKAVKQKEETMVCFSSAGRNFKAEIDVSTAGMHYVYFG